MPPEILYHNREVSEYDLTPEDEKLSGLLVLGILALIVADLLVVLFIWNLYNLFNI